MWTHLTRAAKQHGSVDHDRLASVLNSLPGGGASSPIIVQQDMTPANQGWCREDFQLGNQFSGQNVHRQEFYCKQSRYITMSL